VVCSRRLCRLAHYSNSILLIGGPFVKLWERKLLIRSSKSPAAVQASNPQTRQSIVSSDSPSKQVSSPCSSPSRKQLASFYRLGPLRVFFDCCTAIVTSFILQSLRNFALDFPLAKLYTNALLSTLNARHSWGKHSTTDERTGDDDNVLFGRQADSQGVGSSFLLHRSENSFLPFQQTSRPSITNRLPALRSQRLVRFPFLIINIIRANIPIQRADDNTTAISFNTNNTYELESRVHTTDRTLREDASEAHKDYGIRPIGEDTMANRGAMGVQIHKESQVVLDDEYSTRYSPHPYAHGTQ
jgi:hypothetical protein